ncbi:MAG: hypothetical protein WAR77_02105, partial [Saprospiraceae bacterium]
PNGWRHDDVLRDLIAHKKKLRLITFGVFFCTYIKPLNAVILCLTLKQKQSRGDRHSFLKHSDSAI